MDVVLLERLGGNCMRHPCVLSDLLSMVAFPGVCWLPAEQLRPRCSSLVIIHDQSSISLILFLSA
jgi:hypothetical protein